MVVVTELSDKSTFMLHFYYLLMSRQTLIVPRTVIVFWVTSGTYKTAPPLIVTRSLVDDESTWLLHVHGHKVDTSQVPDPFIVAKQ